MALSETSSEAVYLRRLLDDLLCPQDTPTVIRVDNQAAIAMSKNPINHKRTKHIDVRYHVVRGFIEEGVIKCVWVPTDENLADFLTKPLGKVKHKRITDLLMSC